MAASPPAADGGLGLSTLREGPCALSLTAAEAGRPQALAAGVYAFPGANEPPDAANQGRVGNLGFLIGSDGVVVIDTGSSRARGEELIAAIRSVTALPIRVVLVSHPAQEFLFGAAAFAEEGIPILAAAETPQLIVQRCEHCLDTLTQDLGAARMAGTRLIAPQVLDLSRPQLTLAGRELEISAGPAGTVPGNLLIRDRASGVVFAGALLSVKRVPAVQDTHPLAWGAALSILDDPRVSAVVPAYGPVAWRQIEAGRCDLHTAVTAMRSYLQDLEAQTRELYGAGVPLAELGAQADLPAYRDWNSYQANHLHNIFYRYLQLEAEDLASQ